MSVGWAKRNARLAEVGGVESGVGLPSEMSIRLPPATVAARATAEVFNIFRREIWSGIDHFLLYKFHLPACASWQAGPRRRTRALSPKTARTPSEAGSGTSASNPLAAANASSAATAAA